MGSTRKEVRNGRCYGLYIDALPKPQVVIGAAFWRWLGLEYMILGSGM